RQPYAPNPPSVPSGPVNPGQPAFGTESEWGRPDPACWTADRAVAAGAPPAMPTRPRERESGYWLVIVSDLATPPRVLDARLHALDLGDEPLLESVVQIPSALLGGRTTNWSAFYVGFAVVPDATAKRRRIEEQTAQRGGCGTDSESVTGSQPPPSARYSCTTATRCWRCRLDSPSSASPSTRCASSSVV